MLRAAVSLVEDLLRVQSQRWLCLIRGCARVQDHQPSTVVIVRNVARTFGEHLNAAGEGAAVAGFFAQASAQFGVGVKIVRIAFGPVGCFTAEGRGERVPVLGATVV